MTSPAYSDIKIDSPSPKVAALDIEKYYQWLAPAWERGRQPYSCSEFADEVEAGAVLLVRVWRESDMLGLAACRSQDTLDGRELLIMGLIGEQSGDWLMPLSETFDLLAKAAECETIALEGRAGWQRRLKGLGYKLHQVTMRKHIGELNGRPRLQ